jgi:hypothetical protein
MTVFQKNKTKNLGDVFDELLALVLFRRNRFFGIFKLRVHLPKTRVG